MLDKASKWNFLHVISLANGWISRLVIESREGNSWNLSRRPTFDKRNEQMWFFCKALELITRSPMKKKMIFESTVFPHMFAFRVFTRNFRAESQQKLIKLCAEFLSKFAEKKTKPLKDARANRKIFYCEINFEEIWRMSAHKSEVEEKSFAELEHDWEEVKKLLNRQLARATPTTQGLSEFQSCCSLRSVFSKAKVILFSCWWLNQRLESLKQGEIKLSGIEWDY